jgi:hypothetical protein
MSTQSLKGYMVWIYGDPADQRYEVSKAILRDDQELAIDCDCPYPGNSSCVYTIVLRRQDALLFRGVWTAAKEHDSGTCSCRVYSNGKRLACIGSWEEEGGTQSWYAELSPAEEKTPNQAAEPTRTTVTPPADAGDRASGARGSP